MMSFILLRVTILETYGLHPPARAYLNSTRINFSILDLKKGKVTEDMLQPSAELAKDLHMDSLDMAELLVMAEDEFKVKISLEKVGGLKTLADAVQYVDSLL